MKAGFSSRENLEKFINKAYGWDNILATGVTTRADNGHWGLIKAINGNVTLSSNCVAVGTSDTFLEDEVIYENDEHPFYGTTISIKSFENTNTILRAFRVDRED